MASTWGKALTVCVALGLLTTGCSGSAGSDRAGSGVTPGSGSPSSPAPRPESATPSPAVSTPAPTGTSAGLQGTATDFCTATKGLGAGISASRTPQEAVDAIYVSVAEWREFAPASLRTQVAAVTAELLGVAQNLSFGLYSSNQALATAVQTPLTSPNGAAIEKYLLANCG